MSGFLLVLAKVNLVMGAAIVLVWLVRRPLRGLFGAPIAFAIWLLVPIASVASLLPPRVAPAHVAPMHATAGPVLVAGHTAHSALRVIEQLAEKSATMPPASMKLPASAYVMPDTALLLFAVWGLGMLVMAVYLARLQIRFSAAVRRGEAGPAVLGIFRPRIVTPDSFQEQFTPQEQSAILAHERVHLARQDARINALVAFSRCFCWFNPLIHLGARWLRIDQELACDAIAVSGVISRRDYSMALLKSQVMVGVLPFGCNWPGPQHPLVQRVALLQRKPPSTARRLAGVSLILLAAVSAGLSAWAAQPPGAKKPMAASSAALVTLPAIFAAQDQTTGNAGPGQPIAPANPTGSGNEVSALNNARARGTSLSASARVQWPSIANIEARNEGSKDIQHQELVVPSPDLSQLQFKANLGTPTIIASNALPLPTAGAQPAIPASPAAQGPQAGRPRTEPTAVAAEPVVMANTPSGEGDPGTVVCRAPQKFVDSDQFGPRACGTNSAWKLLTLNGKDLAPDGKTVINRPTVDKPNGEGDPDAVTCRTPQFISSGPLVEVCLTNRTWADFIKNHQIVDPRGTVVTLSRQRPNYGGWYAVGSQGDPDPGRGQSGMALPGTP